MGSVDLITTSWVGQRIKRLFNLYVNYFTDNYTSTSLKFMLNAEGEERK